MWKPNPFVVVLAILLLFVLGLAFCTPPVMMTSAQSPDTATPAELPVGCWYPNGTWTYWNECPVRVVTATPPPPTNTPTPVITATPSPTPSATPPIDPTPETACYGVTTSALNVRDIPEGAKIGAVSVGARLPIIAQAEASDGAIWFRHYGLGGSTLGWSHGDYIELEPGCNIPPLVKRGVHLYTGASCDLLLAHITDYGVVKGISGNEDCMKRLPPWVFTVWRNIVRTGYGYGDGPPQWGQGNPVTVARQWWGQEYATWERLGLVGVVDVFEITNELSYAGDWENEFYIESMRLANESGVCLGVFSDGYGNPTLVQFAERAPALDYMLAHECGPGRHHVISAHSYSRYDSGPWLFDRWQLQRDYWRGLYGDKYDAITWLFTEFGLPDTDPPPNNYDGRGVANCAQAWAEIPVIDAAFDAHDEVAGYTIFGFGNLPPWFDWSACVG